MRIAGVVGPVGDPGQAIFRLVNKVNVPISVDRDGWVAGADDRVIRAAVAMGGRVRNRPDVPGDPVVFRDDHRLFRAGLVKRNRTAATDIRHVSGAVFRRDLDVTMQSGAVVDRVHRESRPESEAAILALRGARVRNTLRSVINRVRIGRDRADPARMKYSASESLVIDV